MDEIETKEEKQSPISAAFIKLSRQIEIMNEATIEISRRIEPILSPLSLPSPKQETGKMTQQPSEGNSNIEKDLNRFSGLIQEIREELDNIIARIQL